MLGVYNDLPEAWTFENIKEMYEARFGDSIPKFVIKAWNKKSSEPYAFGCVHDCQWSPVKKHAESKGRWNRPYPFAMDMDLNSAVIGSKVERGGTDPLAWMDMKYRVTFEHIKRRKGLPLEIHTRSDLVASDDYVAELDRGNHVIYIYSERGGSDLCRRTEPGAPSTERRVKAYERLKALGFNVHIVWQSQGKRCLSLEASNG